MMIVISGIFAIVQADVAQPSDGFLERLTEADLRVPMEVFSSTPGGEAHGTRMIELRKPRWRSVIRFTCTRRGDGHGTRASLIGGQIPEVVLDDRNGASQKSASF